MKKIMTLFKRHHDGRRHVYDEVTPGAEWVLSGDHIATKKFDGTCCLYRNELWWKRYELKEGKTPPAGFEPATEPDPNTGKVQGWVPVTQSRTDKWHREAIDRGKTNAGTPFVDGATYELCGPKVQGNPEQFSGHWMVRHGAYQMIDFPCDFDGIKTRLARGDIEGVVWYHVSDGRMAKIKARDFGLVRIKAGL